MVPFTIKPFARFKPVGKTVQTMPFRSGVANAYIAHHAGSTPSPWGCLSRLKLNSVHIISYFILITFT